MSRKIRLENYVVGRTSYRRIAKTISSSIARMLAALWSFLYLSRPARWAAKKRSIRVPVGIFALIHGLLSKYIWRPSKRGFRQLRRSLGRREVWIYLAVWGVCALGGLVIALTWEVLNPAYLKLLGALIAVAAFTLISFSSPLAGLLTWLLLSPALNAFIQFQFVAGIPAFSGDNTCLVILGASYLFQRKNIVRSEPVKILHICMGLFILGELIAAYRTEVPKQSVQAVLAQYFAPILIYLFARRWITTRKQLASFFLVVVMIGVFFVAFAIPEHFTGKNYFAHSGRSAYIEAELGAVRAQGPAVDPQEFGLVLTLAALTALVWFTYEPSKYKRILLVVVAIAAYGGIAYTLRRSVYIGAILATIFLVLGPGKVRRTAITTLLIAATILAAIWAPFSHSKIFENRIASLGTMNQRLVIQATAVNIFKHHPILGLGFDKYGEGNRKYLVGVNGLSPNLGAGFSSPHSSYLHILVDGGLVTFLPFMGMIVMIFVTSFRMYKRAIGRGLLGKDGIIVFCAFALGVLVQATSSDSFFYEKYLIAVLFFCFGALSGVHLRTDRTGDVPDSVPAVRPVGSSNRYASRSALSSRHMSYRVSGRIAGCPARRSHERRGPETPPPVCGCEN